MKIHRGKQSKPPRLLVYGTPGIGKSTFAAQAPKPIFIPTEDGLDEIECDRFDLAENYKQIIQALQLLLREEHDYQTVVIDSLDWAEKLIWEELCREYGVSSIEKVDGGYARGYTHALSYWTQILTLLQQLREEQGLLIILVAHSKIERFEDPETAAYDRYAPRLHKHAASLWIEWCDAVLFATRKMRIQAEDAGFGKSRAIAQPVGKSGGERILRCVGGPACVAKNRYRLPEELPLDWQSFYQALTTGGHHG